VHAYACLASEFAEMMGFHPTNLSTPQSMAQWLHWKNTNCQPNYWKVCVQLRFTSLYITWIMTLHIVQFLVIF